MSGYTTKRKAETSGAKPGAPGVLGVLAAPAKKKPRRPVWIGPDGEMRPDKLSTRLSKAKLAAILGGLDSQQRLTYHLYVLCVRQAHASRGQADPGLGDLAGKVTQLETMLVGDGELTAQQAQGARRFALIAWARGSDVGNDYFIRQNLLTAGNRGAYRFNVAHRLHVNMVFYGPDGCFCVDLMSLPSLKAQSNTAVGRAVAMNKALKDHCETNFAANGGRAQAIAAFVAAVFADASGRKQMQRGDVSSLLSSCLLAGKLVGTPQLAESAADAMDELVVLCC
jgi:hypothetical protein